VKIRTILEIIVFLIIFEFLLYYSPNVATDFKFSEVMISSLVTISVGLFAVLNLIVPMIFSRIKEYYGKNRWSAMPQILMGSSVIYTFFWIFLLVFEISLFFVSGLAAVLIFIYVIITIIFLLDMILGILNGLFEEIKMISTSSDNLGKSTISKSSYEELKRKIGEKSFNEKCQFEKSVLAYENIIQKQKIEPPSNLGNLCSYILVAIYYLQKDIKRYEKGIPIKSLIDNLKNSLHYREKDDEILKALTVLSKLNYIKSSKEKIVSLSKRNVVISEINKFNNYLRGFEKFANYQIKLIDKYDVPKPNSIPSLFLLPIFERIKYYIWKVTKKKKYDVMRNKTVHDFIPK